MDKQKHTKLSLNPLTFSEAVTDLLKVKPPPKAERKRAKATKGKRTKSSRTPKALI